MQSPVSGKRIDAVDALRGFALAGIVFAHMIEQFIAGPRPTGAWLVEPNVFDHMVSAFNGLFITGKFFSIFAVLFGMSFAIMMGNAAANGRSFSARFIWRLVILLVFGFVHSLIYRGDILVIYAAIGLCLPFFYRVSNRLLWLIVILLFLGAGRYLFYFMTGTTSLLSYELSPDSPVVAAYFDVLKTGSFVEVAKENLTNGFANKFDFQVGVFGRAYLTLAYFLVGMWLVRSGIIKNLDANRSLIKKVMWRSLVFSGLFFIFMVLSFAFIPDLMAFKSWLSVLAFTFYDLINIAITSFFISGFLLLFLRPVQYLRWLAPYGRMALSNYFLQSLIGTFILYGWGLGLLGQLHDWQTFLLSMVVIFLQICLSSWWLSHFYYGPLEWLWRCGTYFKRVKLLR